jgi:hypothetical protein
MLEAGVQFIEVPESYSRELDRFLTAKPRAGKSGKES